MMSKSTAVLALVTVITVLAFLQLASSVAILSAACGTLVPKQGGTFLMTTCGILAPPQAQNPAVIAAQLSPAEAEAFVRHNILTNFSPRVALGAATGRYTSNYDGNGKWNISTPAGDWVLLERQSVAFPMTTTITALTPWTIDRIASAASRMESDISSMQSDISSMERDISSMESDISEMNNWGIMLRRY